MGTKTAIAFYCCSEGLIISGEASRCARCAMRTHFYREKYVFLRYFLANKYCQRIQKSGQNYIKNAKKCNENKKILLRSNFSKLFYSIRILGCVSAPSNDSPMPYTQPHSVAIVRATRALYGKGCANINLLLQG